MNAKTQSAAPRRHVGRGHLKALDGIRGFAILMVIACHAFMANPLAGGSLGRITSSFLFFGNLGVDLFFVLSGFLITGILLDTRTDPHFFQRFYGRRILRIFPLYYGVLFLCFFLTPILHLHWHGMAWLMLLDLQNFRPAFIGSFSLAPNFGMYHFWTLAIEEQFYLLWPAAVFFLRDRRALFQVTVALAAASLLLRLALIATGTGILSIHATTLCRVDSLLIGGILAMLFRSRHWLRVLRLAPAATLATLALVAVSIAIFGRDDDILSAFALHPTPAIFWIRGLRYTVLAVGFAALIAWSLRPVSLLKTVFQRPILRFFGKYSYGIYVLHVPAITLLRAPLRALLFSLTASKALAVAGSGLAAAAIAIVLAILSFHLLEKPFLRLKRLFDYDITQPPARDLVAEAIPPAFSDNMGSVVRSTRHSTAITR